jgi:hypothetical protein
MSDWATSRNFISQGEGRRRLDLGAAFSLRRHRDRKRLTASTRALLLDVESRRCRGWSLKRFGCSVQDEFDEREDLREVICSLTLCRFAIIAAGSRSDSRRITAIFSSVNRALHMRPSSQKVVCSQHAIGGVQAGDEDKTLVIGHRETSCASGSATCRQCALRRLLHRRPR